MTREVPYPKMIVTLDADSDFDDLEKQVSTFMRRPKNYDPILMFKEKEK